jgi:hypothetical protein
LLGFFLLALQAFSQTPQSIHFQGLLNDASGNPVTDTKFMEFRIYSTPTGGTPVWTEQNLAVDISEGLFSVVLGETNSLAGQFSSYPLYITFVVGGEEMLPRQKLQSVPYAIRSKDAEQAYWADDAGYAMNAGNAQKLNNITSDGFVQQDASGNASISGTMTAGAFVGDGSSLTDLPPTPDSDWTEDAANVYNITKNIGIGTATPTATLEVNGSFRLVDGNQADEKILRSDASGNATWTSIEDMGLAQKLNDLSDAKSDNNGSSIFIGINAGENDDSSDNKNVGIGYQALYSNTTGYENTANGNSALYANTTGY